jgi:hypothetical protein
MDTRNRTARPLAAAFALCALATLVLLASHPAAGAHDFAAVLREEAGNRLIDGVVHGGFLFVLAALIVAILSLAQRLGPGSAPLLIAVVSFCIGSAMLMGSMLLDGLVVPAVAARYLSVTAPESLAAAKALFVLAGTLISLLMPLGIAFQAIATVSLGSVLCARPARRRAAGTFGIIAGALILAAIAASAAMTGIAPHLLLGSIALLALWYLVLARLLWRGELSG